MLKFILLCIFICVNISEYNAKEVCFRDLGCFNDSPPFGGTKERLFVGLPKSPQEISVKFYLFNRKINRFYKNINFESIDENYLTNTSTKILIHGFMQNGTRSWLNIMKDEILKVEDSNVIIVDWGRGSSFPYEQAVSNALVVGAEIARLVNNLIKLNKTDPNLFHLIGMSLGAHVAGYAGEKIPSLGRITGLDPAGPFFENTDKRVRLDPSDAKFVDIIHTDHSTEWSFGFGIFQACGHVDFYVNGGIDQPGCPKKNEKILSTIFNLAYHSAKNIITCSHLSVISYFIDSIKNKCEYLAYPCNSKEEFDLGNCIRCSKRGCNRMGYWASPEKEIGALYLNTKSNLYKENFCKKNYIVNVFSKNNTGLIQAKGKFSIIFQDINEKNSSVEILDDSRVTLYPGSLNTFFISVSDTASVIENLYVIYERTYGFFSWLYDIEWKFDIIELYDVESKIISTFCSTKIDSKFSRCKENL